MPDNDWQWRMPCLLQVTGPLVVLAIVVTAPESPRWLAAHGHKEKAKTILVKHHANGAENDPLVEWEYAEIISTLAQEELLEKSRYVSWSIEFGTGEIDPHHSQPGRLPQDARKQEAALGDHPPRHGQQLGW